ncbi:L-tryptophan--pyruvate aminotransferase 1-like isoform X2 [Momordica charantia]|uniref:L-tryptophan--pyruvate aminotransferase 1-like isoform X2 n=1 Tax=Momordica charantia TaxID=3673 RepID=A0A6J1BPR8_MOMCH|nr:L-tryptophan--pyruvate aminotransferase 1-like isoform X2 [Momordica charantia]
MCRTGTGRSTSTHHHSIESNGSQTQTQTQTQSGTNLPLIDLDPGIPTVFEPYWRRMGDKCRVVIQGCDLMSYRATTTNLCWYLLPELEEAIRRLHRVVGNAVVDERHVVVGTGSTQLFQAALYALSTPAAAAAAPQPINVVSAAPYYSCYPDETDYLCSRLYKWAGDANQYDSKSGPFIEVVTSPNNPDGCLREPVVEAHGQGKLIHDLAYYWPQFTPITRPADHDLMYFTFSKCTGHAGSRIGWALVKDREVAIKMTKYMDLSSIGVSKDSQFRAAKIMELLCNNYDQKLGSNFSNNFFEYGKSLMAERWKSLRDVIGRSDVFSLPTFEQQYCCFFGRLSQSYPAFAWLRCKEEIEDCGSFLREHKIEGRSGRRFGADAKYLRISMLSSDDVFQQFLERLSAIKILNNAN